MKLLVIVLLFVPVGGCVRAGFNTQDLGSGSPTDGQPPRDGPMSPAEVTKANDSCSSPYTLDLATLPVSLSIDTAAAKNDYQGCPDKPELVVRYINSPGMVLLTCTGGGRVDIWRGADPANCPALPIFTNSLGCPFNFQGLQLAPGAGHFFVCRGPGEGSATVTLSKF